MLNEIIERVASKLYSLHIDISTTDAKILAKAAIEAMKEPTEAMLDAGAYDLDMTLEQQWKRMIEAALKDD